MRQVFSQRLRTDESHGLKLVQSGFKSIQLSKVGGESMIGRELIHKKDMEWLNMICLE